MSDTTNGMLSGNQLLFSPTGRFRIGAKIEGGYHPAERGFMDDEGIPVEDKDILHVIMEQGLNLACVLSEPCPEEEIVNWTPSMFQIARDREMEISSPPTKAQRHELYKEMGWKIRD